MATKRELHDWAEFILVVKQAAPDTLADWALLRDCEELRGLNRKLQRDNEMICERDATKAETNRAHANLDRAWVLASRFRATIRHTQDPRGVPIGLLLTTDRYNTMGGSECGWAVP